MYLIFLLDYPTNTAIFCAKRIFIEPNLFDFIPLVSFLIFIQNIESLMIALLLMSRV